MTFINAIILSLSILLPLVAGFLVKNKTPFLTKFVNFLCVGFITEIVLVVTSFIGSNLVYFNIYTLLEVILITVIYNELIKNDHIKNIIWFLSILILACGVLNFKTNVIDSTTKFYESLFVIGCSLTYFINSQRNHEMNAGQYLINAGLLIFFACNILIYLFSESILHIDKENYKYLYTIHSYVNFGVNIIYFFGILLIKKTDVEYVEKLKNRAIEEYIYMTSVPKKTDKWFGNKKESEDSLY